MTSAAGVVRRCKVLTKRMLKKSDSGKTGVFLAAVAPVTSADKRRVIAEQNMGQSCFDEREDLLRSVLWCTADLYASDDIVGDGVNDRHGGFAVPVGRIVVAGVVKIVPKRVLVPELPPNASLGKDARRVPLHNGAGHCSGDLLWGVSNAAGEHAEDTECLRVSTSILSH
jgi:hypothetical protein